MSLIREILVDARKAIEDPEHWTQGACARDAQGNEVDETSRFAASWCAVGATYKALRAARQDMATQLIDALSRACNASISEYNDTHTHEEVLAMFDKAIELVPA